MILKINQKFWPLPFIFKGFSHYIHESKQKTLVNGYALSEREKNCWNHRLFKNKKQMHLTLWAIVVFFFEYIGQNLLTEFHALFVLYKWFWCLDCDLIPFLHSFKPFAFVYCCCFSYFRVWSQFLWLSFPYLRLAIPLDFIWWVFFVSNWVSLGIVLCDSCTVKLWLYCAVLFSKILDIWVAADVAAMLSIFLLINYL